MYSKDDKDILRKLAGKVREIAELPEMEIRKKRWYKFNSLKPEKPMILCFPEGSWSELLDQDDLECENEKLRNWELSLRRKIYWWEEINDDNTLEPYFDINWEVSIGDYGVDINYEHGENRGSYVWDPPLKDLNQDLEKLSYREMKVDRETTHKNIELADDIFGDLLPPRIRGGFWWTLGLTWEAIKLVGLENFMLYMYDEPDNLHKLMAWLRDEHLHFIKWFEKKGLLTLDNENDYTGSGGVGYTNELPQPDWKKGDKIRLQDTWGFAESQETVGISPEMFNEFVFPYQLPLLEEFGLNCYGCCEPVHDRLDYIFKIPNLRRISISPWCDQKIAAKKLGHDYIYSRKPNPSQICVSFDENKIREDIANTLAIAENNIIEIIMKDTHTVQNEPWRISRWVEIAREEVNKFMG